MSKLYKRDLYLNQSIDFVIGKRIIEYDMKSAGYNLIKYYNLLSDKKINYLESLNKHKRHIQIGLYEREDREFAKSLTESFASMRELFFNENDLDDEDILSIKKDAVFVFKKCHNRKFKNVEFIEKNIYTSYHRFDTYPSYLEMYYNSNTDSLDIKGINNEKLKDHEEYFMEFLKRVFYVLEINDEDQLISFMKQFVELYKNRELDIGFYRQLSPDSVYVYMSDSVGDSAFDIGVDRIRKKDLKHVDISYNYMRFILPILQRYYFRKIRS